MKYWNIVQTNKSSGHKIVMAILPWEETNMRGPFLSTLWDHVLKLIEIDIISEALASLGDKPRPDFVWAFGTNPIRIDTVYYTFTFEECKDLYIKVDERLPFRSIGYTAEECERDMRRITRGERGCASPDEHDICDSPHMKPRIGL